MTRDTEFDPLNVAAALHVLESELRDELVAADRMHALSLLNRELARIVTRAKAWASERGISIEAIPELPGASATTGECVEVLRRLAIVLASLGASARPHKGSWSANTEPRAPLCAHAGQLHEEAGALLGAAAVVHAAGEITETLEGLNVLAHDLHSRVVALLADKDSGPRLEAIVSLGVRSVRLREALTQTLQAMRGLSDRLKRRSSSSEGGSAS